MVIFKKGLITQYRYQYMLVKTLIATFFLKHTHTAQKKDRLKKHTHHWIHLKDRGVGGAKWIFLGNVVCNRITITEKALFQFATFLTSEHGRLQVMLLRKEQGTYDSPDVDLPSGPVIWDDGRCRPTSSGIPQPWHQEWAWSYWRRWVFGNPDTKLSCIWIAFGMLRRSQYRFFFFLFNTVKKIHFG